MAAWITLQALVLTQIFPPFVYADQKSSHPDTLRAVQRGDSKEGAGEIQAGLETGQNRLGQIVQLQAIHPIWPPTGRIDFPNGAFISIDAGAANRFKGSVREAEAAELLPRDSETNKLLAKLGKYPAGMWPKRAARSLGLGIISVVGHEKDRVMAAYRQHDPNIVFVEQPKPLGTGHAAYHGLAALHETRAPFVVISAGDQPAYDAQVFQKVIDAFQRGQTLAPRVDLVIGTAIFNDPATRKGKGRIVKDAAGKVLGILEEKDILAGTTLGGYTREELLANPEGNVSIYVGRPELFIELLSRVSNDNKQKEFYLTDIVGMLIQLGRRMETAQIPEEKAPDLTAIQDFWRVEPNFLRQQAGLETVVTQPARGFTTRVGRVTDEGVQVAKRQIGKLVGHSTWNVAQDTITDFEAASETQPQETGSANQVLGWTREGLQWLREHQNLPVVQRVWKDLGESVPIEFRADHALTLDFTKEDQAIRLDATVDPKFADAGFAQGRQILYGLGLFHEAAQAAGFSDRSAIHIVVALYENLKREEQEALQALLRSPYLDHGGIWDFFLQVATSDDLFQRSQTRAQRKLPAIHLTDNGIRGVDTLALIEGRDAPGESQQNQDRLDWVIDYRDTWVSWLVGMLQFDIPFDYQKFMQIYWDQGLNLDTKKQLLYQIVRDYSSEVEKANAERVARQAAEEGQEIISGRESTAFSDQAREISAAHLVVVDEPLREAALRLQEMALALQKQAKGDAAFENASTVLVRATEGFLTTVLQARGITEAEGMRYLDEEESAGELFGAIEKFEHMRTRGVAKARTAAERRHEMSALGRDIEFASTPFDEQESRSRRTVDELRALARKAREAFRRAPQKTYAKMVALQRASPTGSINFAYGIGFARRPGQAPNLRERVRTGGQNSWMSPDLSWLEWTNYLVEFIPLFIGERILRFEMDDGRTIERKEVEVDQQQLEAAVRLMADPFATNAETTLASEYVALARECVCNARLGSKKIDAIVAEEKVSREEAYLIALRQADPALQNRWVEETARVASRIAHQHNDKQTREQIEQAMVDTWAQGSQLERFEVLRREFLHSRDGTPRYVQVLSQASGTPLVEGYREMALDRRRPLPTWIMGTTEAPGLTESFALQWLEEEIALRNVVRATHHEEDVRNLEKRYRAQLVEFGEVVLREFGYERRIDAVAAEQEISREDAILRLVAENETLQQEAAKLAVLRLWAEQNDATYRFSMASPDPKVVAQKLEQSAGDVREQIDLEARRMVWLLNRADLAADVERALHQGAVDFQAALQQVIETKEELGRRIYLEHWSSARRWVARELAMRDLKLEPEANRWYRDRTALARTTARWTVVDRYNLRSMLTDPRYNYQSDGEYLSDADQWVESPRKLMYLAAAGPSQVDLAGEATTSTQLKSIKVWPQWVGVMSRLGEERVRRFYGAYHYDVQIRRLYQAEDMKVIKNSRTAMGRAIMNLIEAVTKNDIQDVAYQTRTHGDPMADMFAYREPDKAGATAGYCIPKDILFKVFVSTLTDRAAMAYVGIPDGQIEEALALARQIWAERNDHGTAIEWEHWATAEMLQFNERFKQFVDLGQRGVLIFNVTRIAKMLDRLGVPSAYPGFTQDLYRGLAATIAAERIAELEAVNRAAGLKVVVEIYQALDYARQINPGVPLASDDRVSIELPASYKGVGRGSGLLADVRYSRTLMIAHVMTTLFGAPPQAGLETDFRNDLEASAERLMTPLVASLRPEDEALLYLGLRGFRPESNNPLDRKTTRFVAERLLGINQRSIETDSNFIQARKALNADAADYLDQLENLVTEWIIKTVREDPSYASQVERLRQYKPRLAPDKVTITANRQTAVGSVLGYISEEALWGSAADEALAILQSYGLKLEEIQARAQSGDPFSAWIAHLPEATQRRIRSEIGGRFIPLAIREGGLGHNFWLDIQGKDVVVFGVPSETVLSANAAHIIQAMYRGNRYSHFVIDDHAVQGRARIWHGHRDWAPDVMFAFAAALGYDKDGQPIADWQRRPMEGRRAVYIGNSLPAGSPIVERWRRKEQEVEGRARRLHEALAQVASSAKGSALRKAVDHALEVFNQEVDLTTLGNEFDQVRQYEREVGPDGLNLFRPRDRVMTGALGSLVRGMNEAMRQRGDPALWLAYASRSEIAALGLIFLLNGEAPERIQQTLATVDRALERIRLEVERRGLAIDSQYNKPMDREQDEVWTNLLIVPRLQVEISARRKRQVEVSSVKAPETVNKSLAARAALMLEAEREINLAQRAAGYRAVMQSVTAMTEPSDRWQAAVDGVRGDLEGALTSLTTGNPTQVHASTGRVFAWMQVAAHAAVDQWVPAAQERLQWHARIDALTRGRDLDEGAWGMFVRRGGLLPALFELAGQDPQRRQAIGQIMEMAYAALALEKISPYVTIDRQFVNEPALWLDLVDFFGKTLNDHFDERLPWAFSLARGTGFNDLFDAQERLLPEKRAQFDLYQFAWEKHEWLYRFIRHVMVSRTQLADWDQSRVDALLGRVSPDQTVVAGYGGGAPSDDPSLRRWHGYLQLREITNWAQYSVAILQDTYAPLAEQVGSVTRAMMPYVFTKPVDPSLIHADQGAGLVVLSGVGRPHYQLLIRNAANSELGDNIFITDHGRFLTPEGRVPTTQQEWDRAILWIDDAHYWVSVDAFRQMLIETEGLTPQQADAKIEVLRAAKQIHPMGVRVASPFSRPVAVGAAVTLHHHPLEPSLSKAGYPTTDKSEVLFEVTYGKIFGPGIVEATPLHYPEQVNIYQTDTLQGEPGEVQHQIRVTTAEFASGLPFPAFFSKGSRESASRNLEDFDASSPTGPNPAVLDQAAEFTYQVSRGQDVVLSQDVSLTNSFQTFLTSDVVQHIRNRAVREYGVEVNLQEPGKADVTTIRIIATSPRPGVPYQVSHAFSITSFTGKATNMARQNVAEPLRPDFQMDQVRDDFMAQMMEQPPVAMQAMADFTRRFWHEGITLPDGRHFPSYREQYRARHGAEPREFDVRGVPYWYPTWLMLDFVPAATFKDAKTGQPLGDVRLVDIEPGNPATGTGPVFWLEDVHGNRIQGVVSGHVPWLLEWNTGIGQVPENNRREQYWEYRRARTEAAQVGNPQSWFSRVNWNRVGEADRRALGTWLTAAREIRDAKGFPAAWPQAQFATEVGPVVPAPAVAVPAVRIDPLAVALRGVQARLGSIPLNQNTLSLWLADYTFRSLAHTLSARRAALQDSKSYSETAAAITSDALTLLQDNTLPQQIAELIQAQGISTLKTETLPGLLQGQDALHQEYRERIAFQVLDRFLADSQTVVPVAVVPSAITPEQARAALNQPNTLAVVVGRELKMDHAVEPFALSAVGQAVNVVGVHTDWITEDGKVERVMIYDTERKIAWEASLTEPIRLSRDDHASAIPRAYVVDLPQDGETNLHAQITQRLLRGGVSPINPVGEAQKRADDKAFLLSRRDPDRLHWTLIPSGVSQSQVQTQIQRHVQAHPGERLVVQPRAGTTGAFGVSVIMPAEAQVSQAVAAVRALQQQGYDVIVQRFEGNVTFGGREFVLRSNITGNEIQSNYTLVAPFGELVISTNRGAVSHPLADILDHFIGPHGSVSVSPERMAELDRQAVEQARAINQGVPIHERLGMVAIDRRFWVDEQGQLQQVVLEANARGGGLIAAEPTAVAPSFWHLMGLAEPPSLAQWQAALQDATQATAMLGAPHYPPGVSAAKREQLLGWLQALAQLRTPSGQPAFEDPRRATLASRMPGRSPFPPAGPHLDYIGNQGNSMGMPTRNEVVAFVEMVDGMEGEVEVYVADPPEPEIAAAYPQAGKGPRTFNLSHPWVNPDRPITDLAGWDAWAAEVTQQRKQERDPDKKVNYASDLAALTVSILRTKFGDPSERAAEFFRQLIQEGKGIRIVIVGDLPAGGGLSSSSAIVEAIAQALNDLGNFGLDVAGLIKAGFGERGYANTWGGVKDHAHFYYPLAELGVSPVRVVTQLQAPEGISVLMLDSGVARVNAPKHSSKMQTDDENHINHERNIKARTGIGYALGALWIRRHHPELAARLRPNQDPTNRYGFLRELMPGTENGVELKRLYEILRQMPEQGVSEQQLRDALGPDLQAELNELMAKVPVKPERFPIREMVLFAFASQARINEAIRVLHQLEQGYPSEHVFRQLQPTVEQQHNGDRVKVYQIEGNLGDDQLQVSEQDWNWHLTDQRLDWLIANSDHEDAVLWKQSGWLERSIEPLDLMVDLVKFFDRKKEGGVASAQVIGAGLGGTVSVMVRSQFVDEILAFLEKHYYQKLGLSHKPPVASQPGMPASILRLPSRASEPFLAAAAGLEQSPFREVENEIREAGRKMDLNFYPQVGVVGPDGRDGIHNPLFLVIEWDSSRAGAIDVEKAAEQLRADLANVHPLLPGRVVPRGNLLSVMLPSKLWSLKSIVEDDFPDKQVVLIIGDRLQTDFYHSGLGHPFLSQPYAYAQLLVRRADEASTKPYPNLVATQQEEGAGFDEILGLLLNATPGGQYEDLPLIGPVLSRQGVKGPIDLSKILIISDVDGTVFGPLDTFVRDQEDVQGQKFQGDRLDRMVRLAAQGVGIQFLGGKTIDDISATRIRTDGERLMNPFVAALRDKGIPVGEVGYNGALGIQQIRFGPTGSVNFNRRDSFPTDLKDLTDSQAIQVFHLMLAAIEANIRPAAGLETAQQEYIRRVSGGEAVRWRPMWSSAGATHGYDTRSYDAFIRDYFPPNLIPELKDGIKPLLDRLELESQRTGRRAKVLDGAGGLGVALQQARASGQYSHVDFALNDAIEWEEGDIPEPVREWLRRRAPEWGLSYQDVWTRKGLTLIPGDLSQLSFKKPDEAPNLITVFGALSFFDNPLGSLLHLYNELPDGGILLALLNVPIKDPQQAEFETAAAGLYESVAIPNLQRHGIQVDFRITDRRVTPAVAQGLKEGSPEFQLAFVFLKSPGAVELLLKPESHTITTTTTRAVEAKVVRYVGDYASPFKYHLPQAAGLEQKVEALTEYFRSKETPQGTAGELPFSLGRVGLTPVEHVLPIVEAADLDPGRDEVWVLGGGDGRWVAPAMLKGVRTVLVEMDQAALQSIREAVDHFSRLGLLDPGQVEIIPQSFLSSGFHIRSSATWIYHSAGGAFNPDGLGQEVLPEQAFPLVVEKVREVPGARVAFYLGRTDGSFVEAYRQGIRELLLQRLSITDPRIDGIQVDFFQVAAGLEGPLQLARQQIQQVGQRHGLELNTQWRGIGPDGLYSDHDPIALSLQWFGRTLDSSRVARLLQDNLSLATSHPSAYVSFGANWVAVGLLKKTDGIRKALGPGGELSGKKIAVFIGDAPSVDFFSQNEIEAQPLLLVPFVQVLVRGEDFVMPEGYPNVILAERTGAGVDAAFAALLQAIERHQRYSEIPLFSSVAATLPPELRDKLIDPKDLAIFIDVDNTLLEALDTFDETQAGVKGQIFQAERLNRMVRLAGFGVDLRINSGKSAQEVTGLRIVSDENRLVRPLGQVLLQAGVSTDKVGYDGGYWIQQGRFTPEGQVTWRHLDPGINPPSFTDQEAAAIFKEIGLAIERTVVPAGLEQLPATANPLLGSYAPQNFVIASPAGAPPQALYNLAEADPAQLLADVEKGRRPTLLPKTERVGTALWTDVDHRELLQELYGYIYDIRDYLPHFSTARASRVIEFLHHEDQGVAAAARDVIVNARIFGLQEIVRSFAEVYQNRTDPPGPYAAFYFHDAMTTRVDPVHKVEYGSPERKVFAGEMTDDRMRQIHEQVKLWVDPKNKLSLFTGSGQRMVAPILTANAGFKDRGDGRPTGFPDSDLVGNDIGSQPHDAVLAVFGLVAKLFAENMSQWRQKAGLPMPNEWTVAIGSDGRSTTGAITQVAARIFGRIGVRVKMIGITSAPEAAARAYFSDPEENLLATFEITPSHINPAFIGTKLMLWMGQILPWTKAEEFNKLVQTTAQDYGKIQEVIQMLQDPAPDRNEALGRRIAEDMRQLPAEYQDSRRRYYDYLKRSWTGNWLGDETALDRDWQALKQSLRDRGIVGVLDLNGGARMTDLPLFDDLFEGRYIVMAPDAGSYHHSLPPSRTAAQPMMDFLAKVTPVFEKAGLTLLAVMPDPDGDRKMMTYRDPVTGNFLYLDPQAGYMLDSMALVMAAREAGIPGIGIVSNSAGNPAIRFVLGDRLRAEVRFADVGEANVVQAITNLIEELAQRHGVDLRVDAALPPQARALEMRKRLASTVSVGGGEPPAAAFIQGVMVRDMAQAFGTMFWFYQKPQWIRELIESLVDEPTRKKDLLRQVDERWYQPDQLQYLMHRLVHQILPPMWSADPGDKTEKINAVRPEDQRYFKNVLDQMLAQDGAWVRRIRQEMARIIGEEIDQDVSPEQMTVSEPINYNEAFEVQGRGDQARTLPDGRLDASGGYAVNISYRSAEGTNYLVATLWVRGSKTDIGVTRDLPMMAAPFLRPHQAPSFEGRFREAFHPLWTLFNYAAEAEELRGHAEGRFGGLDRSMLNDLTGTLQTLLTQMRLVRNTTYSRYVDPNAKDHSEVDAGNMGETDAAAQGAVTALQHLSAEISGRLDPLRQMASALDRTQTSSEEIAQILQAIQGIDGLLGVDLEQNPIGSPPSIVREAIAYQEAQRQVVEALRWKVHRFLRGHDFVQGVNRLSDLLADLQAFAAEGTTAQAYRTGNTPEQQNRGVAYANLLLDKIVLVREVKFAEAAAGLEQVPVVLSSGFIILTPETAIAPVLTGILKLQVAGDEKLGLGIIVADNGQEFDVRNALEETPFEEATIINLDRTGLTEEQAIADLKAEAQRQDLVGFVLWTLDQLHELAELLQIEDISKRGWIEGIRRAATAISA